MLVIFSSTTGTLCKRGGGNNGSKNYGKNQHDPVPFNKIWISHGINGFIENAVGQLIIYIKNSLWFICLPVILKTLHPFITKILQRCRYDLEADHLGFQGCGIAYRTNEANIFNFNRIFHRHKKIRSGFLNGLIKR
jgi:hypothetical protein